MRLAAAIGFIFFFLAATLGPASAASGRSGKVRVYVGTYTQGTSSMGIYRLLLDLATGALTSEGPPTETMNPSFLALHPNGRLLYAVNELGESPTDTGGAVSAFAVDPGTGALTPLNQQPSGGAAPCHISLDAQGRHLFVANYWGGTVAVLPIREDGQLGPPTVTRHEGRGVDPARQSTPHAHAIHLDAANRFAFALDLGIDQVVIYRFDAAHGTLTPHRRARLAPGAGPRHFAFHPDGRHAYVINELDSTVTALSYDAAAGTLEELHTLPTLPAGFDKKDNSTAEVVVRSDGKFLYGSNRGHDSIAIFAIDEKTRKLTPAGHQKTLGKTPRNFAIDPTGTYLLAANQDSDTVAVFRIDDATGGLAPVGPPVSVPRPVCLRMVVTAAGSAP